MYVCECLCLRLCFFHLPLHSQQCLPDSLSTYVTTDCVACLFERTFQMPWSVLSKISKMVTSSVTLILAYNKCKNNVLSGHYIPWDVKHIICETWNEKSKCDSWWNIANANTLKPTHIEPRKDTRSYTLSIYLSIHLNKQTNKHALILHCHCFNRKISYHSNSQTANTKNHRIIQ